jgi:hypothetical protein
MEYEMKQFVVLLMVLFLGACGAAQEGASTETTNAATEETHGHDHAAHGHDHAAKGHDHAAKGHDHAAKGHDHAAHGEHGHAHAAKDATTATATADKGCDHGTEGAECGEAKAGGTCACAALKDGTGWCEHCDSGFVNGEKTKDKAAVDSALATK